MTEVNWVQACVEAPLAVLLALFVYKCYRARVRLACKSPCLRWFGIELKVDMPGTSSRELSDSSVEQSIRQTADAHGERGEDVIFEGATDDVAAMSNLAAAKACLEQSASNRYGLKTEWSDAGEVVGCCRLKSNLPD